jgi:Kef-type K+ transport system membrane component KefB
MEIDLGKLRGRLLGLTGSAFLVSLALAVAAGFGLQAAGIDGSGLLLAAILSSTSLWLLVPVLRDSGQVATRFGQLAILAGSLAEFASIVLLTVLFSHTSSTPEARLLLLVLFAVLMVLAARAVGRVWRSRWLAAALLRLDTTAQLRVRGAMVLLLVFVALANELGLSRSWARSWPGLSCAWSGRPRAGRPPAVRMKLESLGFGFVLPFFFVHSGIRFDLGALTDSGATLARVPLFLGLLLLVRSLPAMLYRPAFGPPGGRGRAVPGDLADRHRGCRPRRPGAWQAGCATSASLIAAGLLSAILFPPLAVRLQGQGDQEAAASGTGAPAARDEHGRVATAFPRAGNTPRRCGPSRLRSFRVSFGVIQTMQASV